MGKAPESRVERLVSAGGVVYRRVNGRLEAVLCGRIFAQPSSKAAKGAGSGPDGEPGKIDGFIFDIRVA